jgi:hypothetical protein
MEDTSYAVTRVDCSRSNMFSESLNPASPFKSPYVQTLEIHPSLVSRELLNGALPPEYEYKRLSERHIRLLKLQRDGSEFHCELLLHSLDLRPAPSFEAISYTWGNPDKKKHSLMIEDCLLPITKNVHEILSKFASTDKSRLLWIDAICINQDDDEDKSQQVRLMREIYGTASPVVVWLGSPPQACLAHAFFNQLSILNSRNASERAVLLPTLINDDNPEWLAFRKLLSHPYWARVWVVQEIVVGLTVDVYYGDESWKWDEFAKTVCSLLPEEKGTLLRKINRLEGLPVPHFAGVEKVSMIDRVRSQYKISQQDHHNLASLARILLDFSDSLATEQKDRVFAFLGITSASTDDSLQPDYSKTDREVFEVVARHSLQTKLPFLYFSLAGLANGIKSDDWPSWVLDLRRASGTRLPFPLWDFRTYQASAKSQPKVVDIPEADHEIGVEGVLVDEIDFVAKTESAIYPDEAAQLSQHGRFIAEPDMLAFCERELSRYEEAWEIVQRRLKIYAPNGQSRKEAFWRTWLCDMSSNHESERYFGEYYKKWMKLGWPKIGKGRLIYDRDSSKSSPDQGGATLPENHNDLASQDLLDLTWFPLRLSLISFRRQFAVTKNGYMALVVPGIEVGDVICVFSGAETPHALRRDQGEASCTKYRLVGDAYVHGWMDGEKFKDPENQKRRFVIR